MLFDVILPRGNMIFFTCYHHISDLSICTATAICIDSHFTVTDNNKNQQFVKLPPPLPYFGAKAVIGIQALEVHMSKTSMSEGRIQFI